MENKETTELLNILWKLESASEDKQDWDKYNEIVAELEKRPPFNQLIGKREETNEFSHEEKLESLEEDIKLLKRHKHDNNNGDVLIRI